MGTYARLDIDTARFYLTDSLTPGTCTKHSLSILLHDCAVTYLSKALSWGLGSGEVEIYSYKSHVTNPRNAFGPEKNTQNIRMALG